MSRRLRALSYAVLAASTLLASCLTEPGDPDDPFGPDAPGVPDDPDDPDDPGTPPDDPNGPTDPPTPPTPPTPAPPLPPEVTNVLGLPATPFTYATVVLPAAFRTPAVRALDNTPADNPISDAGATLGRVLFYDRNLSANRTIACASCHVQARGFSDGVAFSTGFAGGHTSRNSMPVTDARFYRNGRFFWDERAATLEAQVLQPIINPVEMGLSLPELVTRVSAQPYYPPLFQRAFGDGTVTTDRIARALAQFSRSLVSYRSRFDQGVAATGDVNLPFPGFTAEENQGKQLFMTRGGCANCHMFNGPPQPGPRPNQAVFFVDRATNNGLDATTVGVDNGIGDLSGRAQDDGRFKSPSLRNVALTGPYMHDGRLPSLAAVVEHYRRGVQPHPNLDPRLRNPDGTPRRLQLSDAEAASLVAFMRTLTDTALTTDPWFTDPFLMH
jgi:cytochrome c peroxidase